VPLRIWLILGVVAAFNIYAGARVIARWPLASQHLVVSWLIVFAILVLQLAAFFGNRLWFAALSQRDGGEAMVVAINWVSYVAFGVMTAFVVMVLAVDIVTLIWKKLAPPANVVDFDRRTLISLGVLALGTSALGIFQARASPQVKRVEIALRNLPNAFDGFTIAQVSDLHVGLTVRRSYTQNVVDIVNGLKPDLIALTGDFTDGAVRDLAAHVAPIGELRARHGMYFVTGNHEYFSDPMGWIEEFTRLGARVLNNAHDVITREGDSLVVAGVTDWSTRELPNDHASNAKRAVAGAPEGAPRIILAHQPASYEDCHAAGCDLQLSGHTHSGQYFPFNLLIGFFHRFARGLNRFENMWIYVNQGTGYWGPPLRTAVPSEITLITLRREAAV
jgi:predicted MPP superfamily phosphohydrolase